MTALTFRSISQRRTCVLLSSLESTAVARLVAFRRAIEHRDLGAEAAAPQLGAARSSRCGRPPQLLAEREPDRYERAALRWLDRYVTEGRHVSLLKAQLALA